MDEVTLRQIVEFTKTRTKKDAIVAALNEYLRLEKRKKLSSQIGNYEKFALTQCDYRNMRSGR